MTIQSGQCNSYQWYVWQWWLCRLFPKRLKWEVWHASSKFHVHTWCLGSGRKWCCVHAQGYAPDIIYICVHIFATPLWCVGLANPKQFSVIYSFIDHRGTVWKCSKLKWNRVVSLQSDQQRTTNCVAWFDINSRVATVREKRGKNENFSRSGKSQGIF